MADVDLVRAELTKNPQMYAGLPAHRIADVMNNPRTVGTVVTYRAVTIKEVYDATSAETQSKLSAASEDYAIAPNAAAKVVAATGVAFYDRLGMVGSVDTDPKSVGRAVLDAATANGYLTTAERDKIVALGTGSSETKQTLWQTWGWDHSVTTSLVEEAKV